MKLKTAFLCFALTALWSCQNGGSDPEETPPPETPPQEPIPELPENFQTTPNLPEVFGGFNMPMSNIRVPIMGGKGGFAFSEGAGATYGKNCLNIFHPASDLNVRETSGDYDKGAPIRPIAVGRVIHVDPNHPWNPLGLEHYIRNRAPDQYCPGPEGKLCRYLSFYGHAELDPLECRKEAEKNGFVTDSDFMQRAKADILRLKVGELVYPSQQIACVWDHGTGGAHLHLEIRAPYGWASEEEMEDPSYFCQNTDEAEVRRRYRDPMTFIPENSASYAPLPEVTVKTKAALAWTPPNAECEEASVRYLVKFSLADGRPRLLPTNYSAACYSFAGEGKLCQLEGATCYEGNKRILALPDISETWGAHLPLRVRSIIPPRFLDIALDYLVVFTQGGNDLLIISLDPETTPPWQFIAQAEEIAEEFGPFAPETLMAQEVSLYRQGKKDDRIIFEDTWYKTIPGSLLYLEGERTKSPYSCYFTPLRESFLAPTYYDCQEEVAFRVLDKDAYRQIKQELGIVDEEDRRDGRGGPSYGEAAP